MTRLPPLSPERLSPEQKALYDALSSGPRGQGGKRRLTDDAGHVIGPFAAWLQEPKLGARWSAVGEALRFEGRLEARLLELAILCVASYSQADHEWAVHAPLALQRGVSEGTIAAIAQDRRPDPLSDDEAAVFDFVGELLKTRTVSAQTWSAAEAQIGREALVELVSIVGYYLALALQLNAFQIAAADLTVPVPWRPGEGDA